VINTNISSSSEFDEIGTTETDDQQATSSSVCNSQSTAKNLIIEKSTPSIVIIDDF
jgi:hypothetical protein